MVGQLWHVLAARAVGCPIRLEAKLLVGPREAIEEVRGLEAGMEILAALAPIGLGVPHARRLERLIHDLPRRHLEAAMLRTQPLGELGDHIVVLATFTRR